MKFRWCLFMAERVLETPEPVKERTEDRILRRRIHKDRPAESLLETGDARPAPLINSPEIIRAKPPLARLLHQPEMEEMRRHERSMREGRSAVKIRCRPCGLEP